MEDTKPAVGAGEGRAPVVVLDKVNLFFEVEVEGRHSSSSVSSFLSFRGAASNFIRTSSSFSEKEGSIPYPHASGGLRAPGDSIAIGRHEASRRRREREGSPSSFFRVACEAKGLGL